MYLSHIVADMCPEECVCVWLVRTSLLCNSVFSRWCFGGERESTCCLSRIHKIPRILIIGGSWVMQELCGVCWKKLRLQFKNRLTYGAGCLIPHAS